jgi:tetratricopeptide (TPR) repeat protein
MRLPARSVVALVVLAALAPSAAVACLWDYDTIKMERTRFPSALELITGKFLRHSPEFYRWRIADRLKRLEADPTNVALLDDLAVAYDKTGQHDKAIETALRTEKLRPGRYETAANLGTFYFHAGRLEDGLPHIDRALAINPNAHFGRELYQKRLVEYVIARRKGGPLKLPVADLTWQENNSVREVTSYSDTFADFLRRSKPRGEVLSMEERTPAITGVLGMMKFGKHDAPVLLEALGTLLTQQASSEVGPATDAKLLAARAFLKASYEVPEGPARVAYRGMAVQAIQMQTPRDQMRQITLGQVEADFQKEVAEGRAWYADLRERELSWIRDGKDPEAEFDKLYEAEPEVSGMEVQDPKSADEIQEARLGAVVIGLGIAAVVGVVGMAALIYWLWRTRAEPIKSS